MYQVGDWIFYGNVGACQVLDIAMQRVPGADEERLYYTLQPFSDSCMISTPADTDKVFMRPVISREDAEALIAYIPKIPVEAYHSSALRALSDHYEEVLNTHDCYKLIEMTMSIYAKKKEAQKQKRKLGAVDEKFMKRAEELLFGELAVALGIQKKQVAGYIAQRVEG
ncbi:MAG: hypothetical protein HFE73_08200 [Firmicutes bacterium]|nr:hypothetical protein [Bacillota bacterium]